MVRQAISMVLVAALAAALGPASAAAAGKTPPARSQTAAGTTQFLLFDMTPAGDYTVKKNGATDGSLTLGPVGSLAYESASVSGDRFDFILNGVVAVTPSVPSGFVATGSTDGCVALSWNTPSTSEYVTNYSLLWGTSPGVYTDSLNITGLDIVRSGSKSTHTRCGMPSGTFHFVLRAHNAFDRWSGLSAVSTTTISNQNAVGPVPPTNVKVAETTFGCAQVTWTRVGDPNVVGYRVYFGTRPRSQAAYTDSIDAGNAASASRCGLAAGTYYFAVRSIDDVGQLSGYSREVSLAFQGADVAAPGFSQRSPAPGATGVPLNTAVFFVVTDDKTGVEPTSIQVKLDGQACAVALTPSGNGYAVQCDAGADLPADTDIAVDVQATDKAIPPNLASLSWTFHTGTSAVSDVTPPALQATVPSVGATGVDPRPTIEVSITDAGVGVNLSTITMKVNNAAVVFSVSGTPAAARIQYRPAVAFDPGKTVTVLVEACDRASTPNCAAPFQYSFKVTDTAATAASGAIVPDGFWANDPRRPLEVRNLRRDWTVRIFDASGVAVRRFNCVADGYTWLWDFNNDDGYRVAPALYLVRVTDPAGSVQSSGRFLVQSGQ